MIRNALKEKTVLNLAVCQSDMDSVFTLVRPVPRLLKDHPREQKAQILI